MIYALLGSAGGALVFAGIAVALALRIGSLKDERGDLKTSVARLQLDNDTLSRGLHKLRGEVQGTILARDREVASLKRRLAGMRAQIAKLPDTPVNRDRVLAELDRLLLSKNEADPGDSDG